MDEHEQRHHQAAIDMIGAYALIGKILAMLPLPIGIPPMGEGPYTAEIYRALIHASEAVQDLPMYPIDKSGVIELVLDWIIGSEWLFSDDEDPAPWKLKIVEFQVARIEANGHFLRESFKLDE